MRKNKDKEEFMKIFSVNIRKAFCSAVQDFDTLQEIRLRAESPMVFRFRNGRKYLSKDNILCDDMDERMTEQDIRDTVGRDFSELFDENYDQLCIRNDVKKCDYSILKIDEDYEGE